MVVRVCPITEFERAIIKERQAEGIRIARQKGVYKGRKAALADEQIDEVRRKVEAGIPKAKIAREYKCSRETIYKHIQIIGSE